MTHVEKPALLIGAAGSGSGKTSIVAGLARSLARAGKKVAVFKIGPDFLDPFILQRAAGSPAVQVDLWMMGEEECRGLLYKGASEADYVLVEGSLGLFDGAPSAADFAKLFDLPIVNVINSKGTAETVHAIALGLQGFRSDVNVVGYVVNNVASDRHQLMIERSLTDNNDFLGVIRRDANAALPSRHLGLQQANEIPEIDKCLDALADLVEKTALTTAFRARRFTPITSPTAPSQPLLGKTIAIAQDEAFSFLYRHNLSFLQEHGAQLAFFSPVRDKVVPACDAVYLPGGYPELHAEQLAANASMRASIRDVHLSSVPIYAECGGMMYLLQSLQRSDGAKFRMCGVLDGTATMTTRLQQLGYQMFEYEGREMRGHTFHYSKAVVHASKRISAVRTIDGKQGESVIFAEKTVASYIHAYFPSNPKFILDVLNGGM